MAYNAMLQEYAKADNTISQEENAILDGILRESIDAYLELNDALIIIK